MYKLLGETILSINPEKCTGCRLCESACSLYNTKRSNPADAYIRVVRNETEGVFVPMLCVHCARPLCKSICPVDAITQDSEKGTVKISEELCVGCKLCTIVCPVGGVWLDTAKKAAVKCSLCEGDPKCVEVCPKEAIVYLPPRIAAKLKMDETAQKIMKGLR